jgi:FkbM family methyltransferase
MLKNLKRRFMRGLKNAALRRRHHLVPDWKLGDYPLARHLDRIFRLHEVDCVLDVGGNMGQYRDMLREDVGFRGWIISFEPVRKYIRHLRRRATTDSRWIIVDCALGAAESTAQIHVTNSPGLNSLLSPNTAGMPEHWERETTVEETVRIARLDDLLPDLRKRADFRSPYLKLDTQGFDLEVLKGAAQNLSEMRALQTEAAVQLLYEGAPTWRDSVRVLEGHGFELSGMFAVDHDRDLRLIEFDCLMVNRRFVKTQRLQRRIQERQAAGV